MNNLIYVIGIVCAIWVIYDVVTQQSRMEPLKKFLWILFALVFNILTAIVYYLTVKRNL
jgi:prolipoprotein diacylglyceryltransferase